MQIKNCFFPIKIKNKQKKHKWFEKKHNLDIKVLHVKKRG